MSRVSSTAKRYAGSSYTSHYSSYSSSLTPSLSSFDRDKLPYKTSSSSSGYSSSGYLTSSTSRIRNYSASSDSDRGRPVPRSTDLLTSRRSESLSRTPVKGYGSGLNGGSGYSGYSYSPAQPSYLSSSPSSISSSVSLSRRKSVSQSDLTRDLSSLGLSEASSSSSSLKQAYRSRVSDVSESYSSSSSTRSGYGLSRSSTQEALSSTCSGRYSTSNDRSSSPARDSLVRLKLTHIHE